MTIPSTLDFSSTQDLPQSTVSVSTYHQMEHHKYQVKKIGKKKNFFLLYILLIVLYIALQCSLLIANTRQQEFIEEHYFYIFHQMEFVGAAVFSFLESALLIMTGNVSGPFTLGFLLFNTTLALTTSLVFEIYPEEFEVTAHYMEFTVQILITFVNFLLIYSSANVNDENNTADGAIQAEIENLQLQYGGAQDTINDPLLAASASNDSSASAQLALEKKHKQPDQFESKENDEVQAVLYKYRYYELTFAVLLMIAAVAQFFIYSEVIHTGMDPERLAHFIEYVNEGCNGLFALTFAILTYFAYGRALARHEEQVSGRYAQITYYKV